MKRKRKQNYKKKNDVNNKIDSFPEVFVEDTFSLDMQELSVPNIKQNPIIEKNTKVLELEELEKDILFQNKITNIIRRIEFEKSFNFLLDFKNSVKTYNRVDIIPDLTEMDIILIKVSNHYKKKLGSLRISYKVYQEIDVYLEKLKFIYKNFRDNDTNPKKLSTDINEMRDKEDFLRYYLF